MIHESQKFFVGRFPPFAEEVNYHAESGEGRTKIVGDHGDHFVLAPIELMQSGVDRVAFDFQFTHRSDRPAQEDYK